MLNNRVLVSFLLLVAFVILTPKTHAQMGSMMENDVDQIEESTIEDHALSVEMVIESILSNHDVVTVQELDLDEISDEEWEQLGDAVMEIQHPGESHEVMDEMMGGEGSESLRQMHIRMGQAYLGFDSDNNFYGSGMMDNGMMGYGSNRKFNTLTRMMGFGSMMGYGAYGNYGIFSAITWILVITFLASGSYYFITQARKGKK